MWFQHNFIRHTISAVNYWHFYIWLWKFFLYIYFIQFFHCKTMIISFILSSECNIPIASSCSAFYFGSEISCFPSIMRWDNIVTRTVDSDVTAHITNSHFTFFAEGWKTIIKFRTVVWLTLMLALLVLMLLLNSSLLSYYWRCQTLMMLTLTIYHWHEYYCFCKHWLLTLIHWLWYHWHKHCIFILINL